MALLLLGVMASGALANGDPFSVVDAIAGTTSSSNDTADTTSSTSSNTTGTSTDGATSTDPQTTTAAETTTSSTTTGAPLSPSIMTDKADYTPGSMVTVTGSGWGAGEPVHLIANDASGQTWSYSADVTADLSGTFAVQFQLPNYFVSDYAVSATGAAGEVASTTFTDAVNTSFDGADDNDHATRAAEENLGTVAQSATAISLTCPRGTGLTVSATGLGNNTFGWTVTFVSGALNNAALSTRTTLTPVSGSFSSGNDSACVAMTINTSTLAAGTYEGQLRLSVAASPTSTHDYFFKLTVAAAANHAPVVGADQATVSAAEGSNVTNTGTWSDQDAGDTVTLTASVGTVTKSGTNASGTWGWSLATSDGPAGPTNVTITASDGHTTTSTTFAYSVVNVAPTATFNSPSSVNEGSSINISLTAPSDLSSADTTAGFMYAFDCGSGYGAFTGTSTASCSTTDDGSRTVKGKIKDKDGGETEYTASVTVNNVAPTAAFPATRTVAEGSSLSFAFTSPSDPSSEDTSAGFHYAFDCAGGTLAAATYAGSGTATSVSCNFPDGPATATVRARIIDKDGGFTEYTTAVTVDNVAPAVSFTAGPTTADESTTAQRTYTFSVSDPGADGFTVKTGYPDCGANGSFVGGSLSLTAGGGSFDCTFSDGPATSTVAIKVNDGDDDSNEAQRIVTVDNVAPTVTLAAANDLTVDEGSTEHTYQYSVSDPGADTVQSVSTSCGANGVKVSGSDTHTNTSGSFKCTFADGPSSSTVSAQATDSDGDSGNTDTQTVTVKNVPPTVSLSGVNVADEGQTKNYTYTVTDPGDDGFTVAAGYPACGTGGQLVGSPTTTASGGSFDCKFPDGPATPTVAIKVADSDGAPSDEDTIDVTVSNVAPTVTLAAANDPSVDEGSTHTYQYSISDPGADTVQSVSTNCGAHGQLVSGSETNTDTAGSFDCTFPDGPASSTVSVQATDSDGAAGNTGTQSVTVNNVAPIVHMSGASAADEGDTKSYTYTVSDPGDDTFSVMAGYPACGSGGHLVGTPGTTASGGSFDCQFPDGPATSTVAIKVADSDDAPSDEDTIDVTVSNVAPTVAFTVGPTTVDESTTVQRTYSFSVSDPGDDSFTVNAGYPDCGAGGSLVALTLTLTANGGSFDCRFPDGPAGSTVAIKVNDGDDDSNEAQRAVTVNNVAPTVTLTGSTSADEGQTKSYSFTTSDPGDEVFSISAKSCGASGGTPSNVVIHSATGTGSFDCAFPDDNPTATASDSSVVSVTVSDGDGGSDSDTVTVTVSNVAPVIGTMTGPNGPIALGGSASVTTSFTDVGTQDVHTCTYSWDDGGPTTTPSAVTGDGSCITAHNYGAAGVYSIHVKVVDDDTGKAEADLAQFVVVYDPSAGFVTGGGWIPSPVGAYRANQALVGKANFGFNAKYKKGANVPDGQTEFDFSVAGFNFHSTAYDWLVVSGAKAQYKGVGQVNGVDGFGFLLTATDGSLNGGGGVDKFRMKIWRLSDGSIVYDNSYGASDDIDAANPQALGGGSIVIHK